jgi:multidrug efflux system membrane fusion protein
LSSTAPAPHGPEGVVRVAAAVVAEQDVPLYLYGLGTAQALVTARVRSQVDGRIEAVHFVEGSTVRQGDPLVTLDVRPFTIALRQAEATLARDLALLRNSKLNRDRDRALLGQQLIAKGTVTDAEALADEGEATVAADRAAVANAKLQLEYAQIRAPISGRTGVRLLDRGNLVRAGDTNALVVITQMDPIAVLSTVAESQLPRLQRALRAGPVTVEAVSQDGQEVWAKGKLALIDNAIDTATGTLKLKSLFDNDDHNLWPGQFVRTRFVIDVLQKALVVPEEALLHGDSGDFVYVLDAQNKAQVRPVQVGERAGHVVQIPSGLKSGERVVTEGQLRLRAGTKVSLGDAP